MKNIDELVADKLLEVINIKLSRVIKSDFSVDNVTQIDDDMIEELKQRYDIEGVILDVDSTLRKNMKSISPCNQEWIKSLKGKLKIMIVSNGHDAGIKRFFEEQGIDYIGFAHKPLKHNFIKACKQMEVDPSKVLMVGDRVIEDVMGAKRNGMKTVLVKSVLEER